MRSSLNAGKITVAVKNDEFESYLKLHSMQCEFGTRPLSLAISRLKVVKVLKAEPALTVRGFDHPHRVDRNERKLSPIEQVNNFENRRLDCLTAFNLASFELACLYLNGQQKIESFNHSFGSYQLKHRAEDLSKVQGEHSEITNYVSNGMFIIAAISLGFKYKQIDPFSPNAFINISSKSVRSSALGPLMTRNEKIAALDFVQVAQLD
jgi:hypothetical protein